MKTKLWLLLLLACGAVLLGGCVVVPDGYVGYSPGYYPYPAYHHHYYRSHHWDCW